MKKIISALLLVTVALFAFASCNNNKPGDTFTPDFKAPATDKENFVYEGTRITGLTEAGKAKTALTVPADATEIAPRAFAMSTALENLVIAKCNTQLNLSDSCFSGTKSLKVYIGCETTDLLCGKNLLDGSNDLKLLIVKDQYVNFKEDYTFGAYKDQMQKYEK